MRLAALGFMALLLTACGGSTSQDGGTGGGGTGGTGATGASGGSGGIGGGGTGGTGAVGGVGGTSCSDFLDEPLPTSVTIRVVNKRATPIYVGGGSGCGNEPLYTLSGPGGLVALSPGGCGFTCEALQAHGDMCPDACFLPPTIFIAPGGSFDTAWAGTSYEAATMPASCYFEPQYALPTCNRRRVADPANYVAKVDAGSALTCLDVGMCSCTPDAQGSCEITYGGTPSGDALTASATFTMPGSSVVMVEFQ
ncbi:MAG: hypothetical protein U0263_16790 [Polyangiaceae bacterium]